LQRGLWGTGVTVGTGGGNMYGWHLRSGKDWGREFRCIIYSNIL
jgi:hypothetical protein